MKICRFQPLNIGYGPQKLTDEVEVHPAPRYGLIQGEQVIEIRDAFHSEERLGRNWALSSVKFLPPSEPSKIVCVGRNYAEHAAEMGNTPPQEPLIFLKPPSAIIGPEEPIVLTPLSERVDHEGELAIVIGKKCSRLKPSEDAWSYVLGYTCLNDVTARDLQKKDVQFTRAKGFDTFCPFGPVIETDLDLGAATIQTFVNGKKKQSARASEMIFPVDVIIRWISQVMTLLPGDVIATGTPSGVGPLSAGDVVEVVVGGVGTLRNPVAAAG
ncbi:MAG TPA: fumarylacetoacetate hydrolase family protein [Candidatus Acidoferrales bacterium]|nr:fumarylacetoacetate hydrolase family protein [Candidatus Acidoferrales bacterium]